jgi:hypothetical protein
MESWMLMGTHSRYVTIDEAHGAYEYIIDTDVINYRNYSQRDGVEPRIQHQRRYN